MRWLSNLWFRLRAAVRPGLMERELDDEFAFHLEMETAKLIREGRDPEAAAAEARRRFDGPVRPRQLARDNWGTGLVREFATDIKHALRQIRRRPGFSVLGIGALGLGLGATIGMYGVVRAVLLRPLPIVDEAQVRVFWSDYNWRGVEFDYLKERTRAFARLAAYSTVVYTYRSGTDTQVLNAGITSAELFDVLGVVPALGRTFRAGEDRPGAEPVVVVSDGMWRRDLGADRGVVGKRISLNGKMVTVIGVMPKGFFFPTPELQLWTPLNLDPASGEYQGNGWLVLLGRLKPGVGPSGVADDVTRMASALGERFTYPAAWDKTKNAGVRTVREYLVGDVRPALLLLMGAGSLLLLMACANVAALVLARTTDRSQEITLRAALGAGRGRLIRQIVAESFVLSVLATIVGFAAAGFGFKLLVASLPLRNEMGSAVTLDWSALAVAAALAAVVSLLVAAAPARDLLRGKLQGVSGARGAAGLARSAGKVHTALVGTEAMVAGLLVVGALMLIRSVAGLLALDLGFDPSGVVAVDLIASGDDFTAPARAAAFQTIRERAAAIPGVSSAAWTWRLPVRDGGWQGTVSVDGQPDLQGAAAPNALFRPVSPEYFSLMRIPVVTGRVVEATDRVGTPPVAVVSRAFAERAWPGQNPVGRQLHSFMSGDSVYQVVGVVNDVRSTSVTGANPFVLYAADAQQEAAQGKVLVLRLTAAPGPVYAALRRIIAEVDPRIAIFRTTSMKDVVAGALAEPLQLQFFLSLFAGLALALGTIGIYSVASYSVARRQTELGLRMALGASPAKVLRQIVTEGVTPVAAGTAAGIVMAVALARGASRFLYGVSPADPVSLAGAAAALLGAGLLAALIPAWRASRVSPVDSLRAE